MTEKDKLIEEYLARYEQRKASMYKAMQQVLAKMPYPTTEFYDKQIEDYFGKNPDYTIFNLPGPLSAQAARKHYLSQLFSFYNRSNKPENNKAIQSVVQQSQMARAVALGEKYNPDKSYPVHLKRFIYGQGSDIPRSVAIRDINQPMYAGKLTDAAAAESDRSLGAIIARPGNTPVLRFINDAAIKAHSKRRGVTPHIQTAATKSHEGKNFYQGHAGTLTTLRNKGSFDPALEIVPKYSGVLPKNFKSLNQQYTNNMLEFLRAVNLTKLTAAGNKGYVINKFNPEYTTGGKDNQGDIQHYYVSNGYWKDNWADPKFNRSSGPRYTNTDKDYDRVGNVNLPLPNNHYKEVFTEGTMSDDDIRERLNYFYYLKNLGNKRTPEQTKHMERIQSIYTDAVPQANNRNGYGSTTNRYA